MLKLCTACSERTKKKSMNNPVVVCDKISRGDDVILIMSGSLQTEGFWGRACQADQAAWAKAVRLENGHHVGELIVVLYGSSVDSGRTQGIILEKWKVR